MLRAFTFYSALIVAVYATGELTIVHSPSGLGFSGNEPIPQNVIKEVFSAALGFTTEYVSSSPWSGMFISNPFNLPDALVTVTIDGLDKLPPQAGFKGRSQFPIKSNEDMYSTWSALENRVMQHFPLEATNLVNVELSEGSEQYEILGVIKPKHSKLKGNSLLKPQMYDEDNKFLNEMETLDAIRKKISTLNMDTTPDVFFFHVSSLTPLLALHGNNSKIAEEAFHILGKRLEAFGSDFVSIYQGKVLVTIITDNNILTRRTRSLLEEKATTQSPNATALNLAKSYNADYPVMFNILLWFGVAFVFSLLAISITIGSMDPGRDSIIYRMTSTRIKKDN